MTRCARCQSSLVWTDLAMVQELALDQVRAVVTHWPEGVKIEVRRCPCGTQIARKTNK